MAHVGCVAKWVSRGGARSSLGTSQGPWKAINNWNCPPPQHCSIIFLMNIKCMKLSWQGATSCNCVCLFGRPRQTELSNAGTTRCRVTLLVSLAKERLRQTLEKLVCPTPTQFLRYKMNNFFLWYIKHCGIIKQSSAPPLVTHRLVNRLASYASHKQRWWWPGWWSQPERPAEATMGPSGCGPSAQTSPRGCRSCWWRCTGTRQDPTRCPGWRCGARCSCPCCWWRSVRLSCRFPVEGEERTALNKLEDLPLYSS